MDSDGILVNSGSRIGWRNLPRCGEENYERQFDSENKSGHAYLPGSISQTKDERVIDLTIRGTKLGQPHIKVARDPRTQKRTESYKDASLNTKAMMAAEYKRIAREMYQANKETVGYTPEMIDNLRAGISQIVHSGEMFYDAVDQDENLSRTNDEFIINFTDAEKEDLGRGLAFLDSINIKHIPQNGGNRQKLEIQFNPDQSLAQENINVRPLKIIIPDSNLLDYTLGQYGLGKYSNPETRAERISWEDN